MTVVGRGRRFSKGGVPSPGVRCSLPPDHEQRPLGRQPPPLGRQQPMKPRPWRSRARDAGGIGYSAASLVPGPRAPTLATRTEAGDAMISTDAHPLAGKVAIVTGAASGIGRASALLFAQAGARVVLVDARQPELEATTEETRAAAGDAEAAQSVVADLTQPEACAA